MTEQELAAIEARAAAATEGPWEVTADQHALDNEREHCQGITAPPGPDEIEMGKEYDIEPRQREIVVTDSGFYPPLKADAAFIAHARTDVPALVCEVRRVGAERDSWRSVAEQLSREAAYERTCRVANQDAVRHLQELLSNRDERGTAVLD